MAAKKKASKKKAAKRKPPRSKQSKLQSPRPYKMQPLRVSSHQRLLRDHEVVQSELATLESNLTLADELSNAVRHKNWDVATQVAEEWFDFRNLRIRRKTKRVFSAQFKLAAIRAYQAAPYGRKGEILEYYKLEYPQMLRWIASYDEGGKYWLQASSKVGARGTLPQSEPVNLNREAQHRPEEVEEFGPEDEWEEM